MARPDSSRRALSTSRRNASHRVRGAPPTVARSPPPIRCPRWRSCSRTSAGVCEEKIALQLRAGRRRRRGWSRTRKTRAMSTRRSRSSRAPMLEGGAQRRLLLRRRCENVTGITPEGSRRGRTSPARGATNTRRRTGLSVDGQRKGGCSGRSRVVTALLCSARDAWRRSWTLSAALRSLRCLLGSHEAPRALSRPCAAATGVRGERSAIAVLRRCLAGLRGRTEGMAIGRSSACTS